MVQSNSTSESTKNNSQNLCPICNDSKNCSDIIGHAKLWNTDGTN